MTTDKIRIGLIGPGTIAPSHAFAIDKADATQLTAVCGRRAEQAAELADQPDQELAELTRLYEERGVQPETALAVAQQMTAFDALGAHSRDELGISHATKARPLQAALTSALTFTAGAAAPLVVVPLAPPHMLVPAVGVISLVCLAVLGALGARTGGAPILPSVLRVVFWGALAMAITAGVGKLFGVAVG